jgi:hypothetical protein
LNDPAPYNFRRDSRPNAAPSLADNSGSIVWYTTPKKGVF